MAFNPNLFNQLIRAKRKAQAVSVVLKIVGVLIATAVAGVGGYTAYQKLTEKPACTEHVDANTDGVCDVCEEHVHVFADATCTTPATCECGATEGAALGHSHEAVVTDPTCTEAGYTTYTCSCGDTYTADEVEASGHDYKSTVTAPTCTEAGYTTYTCGCGDTYTADEVAALGHKFVDGKCECDAEYVAPAGEWELVTELKNGDLVLIGNPAYGKLLSANKVSAGSYYNKGIDYSADNFANVTDAEIFAVTVNADGSYTFTSLTGDVIALAGSYSSLNVDGEHKSWTIKAKGDGTFLIYNTGRKTYLEWYSSKNNWSTYTAGNTTEYYLSFYAQKVSEENHVHNYISELHAPTCTEAGYTSYTCSCGDSYKVAGEDATGHSFANGKCFVCGTADPDHVHSYTTVVTAPTCTEAGYTTYTCVCEDTYTADEVAALGHSFSEGVCGVCGAEDPDYVKPDEPSVPAGGEADFDTIKTTNVNGDSSYTKTFTTANSWTVQYSAIQAGGSTNMNPQFTVIGPDNTHKAICLNGKTTAPGKLTSPTLTTGISKLTINYTKMFTDTALSVTVTITDAAGNKYTHVIAQTLPKDEKYVVYTDVWTLETPIVGEFTIEIVNNCPSGSTSNKDRFTILDLVWEGVAATPDPETFAFADYVVSGELGGGAPVREMGENITFSIATGWINGDTGRIYKGSYATIESDIALSSVVINAGYKDSTFDVYVSENGENWVLLGNYAYVVDYSDVTISFETPTKYVKIDAPNQQVRMKTITVTYA